jgi:hypothetical protein
MGVMRANIYKRFQTPVMAVVAILVALGEDSETLPSDRRPIVLIRKGAHVRIARSMLAAAGHKGCDLVGSLPADAELLVLPDAGRGGLSRIPRVPCLVRYDSAVLALYYPTRAFWSAAPGCMRPAVACRRRDRDGSIGLRARVPFDEGPVHQPLRPSRCAWI